MESQPTKTAEGVEKENLRPELLPWRQRYSVSPFQTKINFLLRKKQTNETKKEKSNEKGNKLELLTGRNLPLCKLWTCQTSDKLCRQRRFWLLSYLPSPVHPSLSSHQRLRQQHTWRVHKQLDDAALIGEDLSDGILSNTTWIGISSSRFQLNITNFFAINPFRGEQKVNKLRKATATVCRLSFTSWHQ